MAKADWESEDFEPKAFQKSPIKIDRWEGEDEDDDVKDNWDDEEEEKEQPAVAVQPKRKKNIAQIVEEKEEKKRKELEEKMKQMAQEQELTPEELLSEKLLRQKLQEDSDLELAKETFGTTNSTTTGIDNLHPTTKDDFEAFRKELVEKVTKLDNSPHYIAFLEDLCRDFCLSLQHEDIKRITSNLNALATEKLKAQKATKGKKKSKKATLHLDKDEFTIIDYGNDEFEDFI